MDVQVNAQDEALKVAKKGMRLVRDAALASTDWMVMPDSPLGEAELARVKAYRQHLRDLPATMQDADFMTFKGVPALADFAG